MQSESEAFDKSVSTWGFGKKSSKCATFIY